MSVRRWPDTLPGPSAAEYGLSPIDPTVRTAMEVGAQRTRRRTLARMDRVKLQWRLSPQQYAVFRSWYEGLAVSLLGSSDDLAIWSLAQNVTRSAGAAISPDLLAVDRILETTATGAHRVEKTQAAFAVDNANLLFRATVKAAGRGLGRLWIHLRDATAAYTDFDLTAGTLGNQAQLLSRSIEDRGNGWWRVRVWRANAAADTSTNGDQLLWVGLRSYMAEPEDRGPVTLIALRMRATNNLSLQSSRRIGVIATRKIPVYSGTWSPSPVASSSIAWAIADIARNADYGAGLSDSQIDLAALLDLKTVWAERGDSFNGRFDSASSWWDALQKIAAAGRAQCFMQGGILRVVRDGPQSVPVALFSMRNIKAGSFSYTALLHSEATADAVTVTYWDATTWAPQRVTGKVPGSTAAKPAKMTLFGVDNRNQALREATYHAAANRYRRRIVRFATEMEGFIPAFGDLIAVQHDMLGWGAHAEATGWDAGTRTLTLSEPVVVTGASVVGLRRDDGSPSGPWAVTAGANEYEVVLTLTPDMTPEAFGQSRERTHVTFGTIYTWATLAKVIRVQPRGLCEVEIEVVTEDPSVHTAEDGVVAPPIRTSNLPRRPTKPVVSGLFARRIPGDATRAVFGWRPAQGAEIYNLEMAEGDNVADPDTGWTRVADTAMTQRAAQLMYTNRTMVRVRGSGLAAGPWIAATLGALIPDFWLSDDTPFWTADTDPFWSN